MRLRTIGVTALALGLVTMLACGSGAVSNPCAGAACTELDGGDGGDGVPPNGDASTSGTTDGGRPHDGVDMNVTPDALTIYPGTTAEITVHIIGTPPEPMKFKVTGLPQGITASDVVVDGATGTLTLTAASDAPIGDAKITVTGTTSRSASAGYVALKVRGVPGSLDTTFGQAGFTTTDFGGTADGVNALDVDLKDSIVTAGYASVGGKLRVAAARFLSSGALDTTFGGGAGDGGVGVGRALYDLSTPAVDSYATSVLVEPSGKLMFGGNRQRVAFAGLRTDMTGAPDTTFAEGGLRAIALGGLQNVPTVAIARQPDGKIVFAGSRSSGPGNDDFVIARLDIFGAPDAAFGNADAGPPGRVVLDLGGEYDEAFGVAVQPDGKIVVVGRSSVDPSGDLAIVRLDASGALDPTFGAQEPTPGVVKRDFGPYETIMDVALQPDGKIVVAGATSKEGFVARLDADGTFDTTFGTGGRVATPSGATAFGYQAVALQKDGKILAAGYEKSGATRAFALARYDAKGAPDPTFGTAGVVTNGLGSPYAVINALALQKDGRIVVGGSRVSDGTERFAIARFWP